MIRRSTDNSFNAQIENLKRLRRQNNQLIKDSEIILGDAKSLENSLIRLGNIVASGRTEARYSQIENSIKEISNSVKEVNETIKECCIEPSQRMENLHAKVDKSLCAKDKAKLSARDRKNKYEKITQKYGRNPDRPSSQAKVEIARNEYLDSQERYESIGSKLDPDILELLKILPQSLMAAHEICQSARNAHSERIQHTMQKVAHAAIDGTPSKLDHNGILSHETSHKILNQIKKLKIVDHYH
jgi:uncharacterized protein YoxC